MRVQSKSGKKENKDAKSFSKFSFFLLVSLFLSVIFFSLPSSLAASNGEKLSIVLINGDEIYVRSGNYYTFLQDYQLYVKGADTGGKSIWIELRRDGASLKDAIATEGSQFVYEQNSTEILNLTVDTIYAGSDGVLVKFSPVYQYLDPRLPMPQNPNNGPFNNFSEDNSSESLEADGQAEGFDTPLFLLSLGAMLLVTGLFAGKGKRK
jgi:hypothetical protein